MRALRFSFLASVLLAACPTPEPTDAGSDAALPYDGGSCATDEACDNGRFCDGLERCVAGSCARGEAPACDDGVACTIDRCSEAARACESVAPDLDGDGFAGVGCLDGDDCDDDDADRFPGNAEVCDLLNHDEDCDDGTRGLLDEDGDGFESARCCNAGTCGDDCDDVRSHANPSGVEVCNGIDDDCNGSVDEGVLTALYEDRDRDGYGTGAAVMRCGATVGFAIEAGDCNDTPGAGLAESPGQAEFCDDLDNDCDTRVDEMAGEVAWYPDDDEDGFGAIGAAPVLSCAPISGRSLRATDCDDTVASIGPGSAERCDGRDDDCNGLSDFVIGAGDFEDDDGDGVPDLGCGAPLGVDCDDRSAAIGPGSAELCDGRDNDCDATIDEGASTAIYFRDRDGDGFGSEASGARVACIGPAGFVLRGGDCDDGPMGGERFPGAIERCDGRDDDCDGSFDESPASLSCDLPNATSVCVPGAGCVAIACDAGFAQCGSSTCVDVRADPFNCGACGRSCRAIDVDGTSECVDGACVVSGACTLRHGDCNRDGVDGCEASFDFDAANCGGCGTRCPAGPFEAAQCLFQVCTTRCQPGHYDCDGLRSNGCESAADCTACGAGRVDCDGLGSCEDLTSDAANCGACGVACGAGASCLDRRCDRIVQVVTGVAHTCVRREGGGVACWGASAAGSGDATPVEKVLPAPAVELASSLDTTCAVLSDGRVFCWGRDLFGELGDGGGLGADRSAPGIVSGLATGPWHLAAGARHFVAYQVGGPMRGWGNNTDHQLDSGTATTFDAPVVVSLEAGGTLRLVEATASGTCGFFESSPWPANCIGRVVGSGGTSALGPMGELYGSTGPWLGASVHGGNDYLCFATAGEGVQCVGNPAVELGMAIESTTAVTSLTPSPIFGRIGGSFSATCAIDDVGRVRCYGGNAYNELGASGPATRSAVQPTGLPRASVISEGFGDHSCAVDLGGRLYCWGRNHANQCTPDAIGLVVPTLVSGL